MEYFKNITKPGLIVILIMFLSPGMFARAEEKP